MARPREPIALLEAKGRKHLTKAEREARSKAEVKAACDHVVPARWLTKREKEKFDEIAKELLDIGIMSNLDCDILSRYVRNYTEYEKVTRQMNRIKFVPDKTSQMSADAQTEEQTARYNYLQKILARIEKQCNTDARELGLTIASRCRLVMPEPKETKPENKFIKHA